MKPLSEVQLFDPLCEVQSDKASVEITSPYEGIVKELLVKEGEVAKVGENLCLIEVVDESPEDVEKNDMPHGEHSAQARTEKQEDDAALAEQQSTSDQIERQLHPLDPRSQNQMTHPRPDPTSVLALPSVRHFAKERGVDIALLVPGSGKGGRIEKRDVEQFLSRGTSQGSQSQALASSEGEVAVELGRTRHAMWKAMVKVSVFRYSVLLLVLIVSSEP